MASLWVHLEAMESSLQWATTIPTMPLVFLYGLPGYGPATTNEAQGGKFQQIKQPADISMEPAGKLPTRHVLAAAGCGTQPLGAATVAEDAPKDAKGGPGGGRPRYRVA